MSTTTSKKAVSSTKKIVVTGDEVNPTMEKSLGEIVGKSLDSERQVWLDGCDLLHRNIVSGRGLTLTIEKVISEKGNLPTITSTGVQYWLRAFELSKLKGGDKQTLKQLFQLARELPAFVNSTNKKLPKGAEKLSFEKVIEGQTLTQVRQTVPTQGEAKKTRKPSTDKNTKFTAKTDVNGLIKALEKALSDKRGGKVDMKALEALAEKINEIMFESEEAAA